MALSATNLTSGSDVSGSITGETTASITLDANALALLVVLQRNFGSAPSTPVASGWTQITTVSFIGVSGFFFDVVTVLRRLSGSSSTGTVTFTCGLSTEVRWSIDQWSGVNIGGTNGANAIAQSGTSSDSSDSQTSFSFDLTNPVTAGNASYGAFGTDQSVTLSVGSGYSLLALTDNLVTEWQSPASQTIDASSDAPTSWGGIGLEIVPAPGAVDPLFGRSQITNSVISEWQPSWPYLFDGRRQPYAGRQLPPDIASITADNPPVGRSVRQSALNATVWQWRAADWPSVFLGGWQPYQNHKLNPSITPVVIDAPVPQQEGRNPQQQAIIVAAAQPDPWVYVPRGGWQPYAGRKLPPSLLSITVDNPPIGLSVRRERFNEIVWQWRATDWPVVFAGGRQAYAKRVLQPSLINVIMNNPPFLHPGRLAQTVIEISYWQPTPWPTVFMGAGPYKPRQLIPPSGAPITPHIGRVVSNVLVRCRLVIGRKSDAG